MLQFPVYLENSNGYMKYDKLIVDNIFWVDLFKYQTLLIFLTSSFYNIFTHCLVDLEHPVVSR